MSSMPARVTEADQNDLNPSMRPQITSFESHAWSCSAMLLRSVDLPERNLLCSCPSRSSGIAGVGGTLSTP